MAASSSKKLLHEIILGRVMAYRVPYLLLLLATTTLTVIAFQVRVDSSVRPWHVSWNGIPDRVIEVLSWGSVFISILAAVQASRQSGRLSGTEAEPIAICWCLLILISVLLFYGCTHES